MPIPPESICLLGHHEPGYPRNESVRKALEAAGFRVLQVHSRAPFPWRHFILAWGYLRVFRGVEWVFVTEGGHRLVPFLKLFTMLTGRKLAFDPFLSRYNTRVEDRRLHAPGSFQALVCRWQDWSSTQAADFLLFDTLEHKEYFYRAYRLRKPFLVFPMGVDESVFRVPGPAAPPAPSPYPKPGFQVLFYGSYIPLQGVEWIVEAAALSKDGDVRFTLIGEGQTFAEVSARARALEPGNLEFLPSMSPASLAVYLFHADINLGIFGDSLKAGNVVANKIVQGAAMGKPIITRESPAVLGYFRDGESIALVPAASPKALAGKILELRADAGKRKAMGEAARKVFERSFSVSALSRMLKETFSRSP
ncbi:MAG: glycosyl transferase group 1 [Fibrobacteres bacterium]|nr:glycosyl transferase group 1 [Fibrobacterota bacterium]